MVVHTYTAEIYYYQNKLHDITQYGKDHGGLGFQPNIAPKNQPHISSLPVLVRHSQAQKMLSVQP